MSDWFTQNLSTSPAVPPPGQVPPAAAQPPAQPGISTGQDWFSKNLNGQPATQPGVASTPAPTQAPQPEGTYAMQLNGQPAQIPFSKVEAAKKSGYTFAGDTRINPWYFVPGSTQGKNLRQTKAEAQYNSDVQDSLSKRIAREVLASPGGREMIEGDGLDLALGAAREVARDAIGAHDIVAGRPQATDQGQQPKKSALREFAEEANQGFGETAGSAIETTGEFMVGEGLIKGLTKILGYVPKLAEAAKIEQEIQKGSAMGQLFKTALKQAAIGGGQEFVKSGGDVAQTAETAALTGGLAFAGGAVGRKLGAGLRNAMPGTETIGGEEFQTPAARDIPKPTPNQAAGQATIEQAAKDTGQAHLEELNQSRAAGPTEGAEREYFKSGNTWAERLRWSKAQMAPVDVPSAIDKIGSFSDTASTLKNTAAQGYNHITDALGLAGETPQKLNQIRQAYQAAEAKYMAAETPEALHAAEQEIEDTHGQLRDMVGNKIPNAVSLSELSGLNTAYGNSLGLEKFARAVDKTFTGSPTSKALRAGEYFGFDGQKLGQNIRSFVRTMGSGRAERLIGRDRLDTLLRVADLNTNNAGRSKFGTAIRTVGENLIRIHVGPIAAGGYLGHMAGLPWELGAGAGWATAEGTKKLTQLIVSKPQLAKNVLFALDSGARPEKYGPFIATMIRNMVEQANKEEPENADQAR